MKGCKLKVNQVPSSYCLWLARVMSQGAPTISKRMVKKGQNTFGFNKMAIKMKRLGYRPKYERYPSEYAWFDQ